MTTLEQTVVVPESLLKLVDERTLHILDRRRRAGVVRRRGWLVRRMLLLADVLGLVAAFAFAEAVFGAHALDGNRVDAASETLMFACTLPLWIVAAKLYGLYDKDEERTHHTTVDDFTRVFHLITVGAWLVFAGARISRVAEPDLIKMGAFWVTAICAIPLLRAGARAHCRRRVGYLQNAIVVGAGNVGQLIARKLMQHPEYGINLVGFVDADPIERRSDLGHLALLGGPERLPDLVRLLDVERVIFAFNREPLDDQLASIRALADLNVQVDIVPRLFEIVGPNVDLHDVEGLPLVGLRPVRLPRSSRLLKRALDIAGASIGLLLTAPLFAFVAWRIKQDSPGPIFFRQTRLGLNMREFTILKFRTMKVGTPDDEHREYVRATMDRGALPGSNGVFKLERESAITRVGGWLRRTSLDELPQLINVLRGDMSLVGPRPCLAYEAEGFEPHHFDRFHVPAGITGLWQVTARAHSTFGEALDLDVAYAHAWSLGLDLRLLFLTPLQLLRQKGTR
jgi:exopolysaccharide biosynthesis polyprenyl glycosylphosphotransferase